MSTIDTLPNSATQPHPLDLNAKQIGIAVVRLVSRAGVGSARALYALQERNSQKRSLLSLDTRMLKDLGLTQADVENAFRKISVWHLLGR